MGRLILLLGGNQGDVSDTFDKVHRLLNEHIGDIVQFSALYESEPWGFESENNFINQVVELQCSLGSEKILSVTQKIEQGFGRKAKSTESYSSRPLDIDILFYDDLIVSVPELTIPHPRLHERMFTLLPLSEKWEQLIHPVLNKSVKQMKEECDDTGWVKKQIIDLR